GADLTPADLVSAVEATGYSARLDHETEADESETLRPRLIVSVALALPVILLAMVPRWQFDGWQWLSLALATPVVTWGAWPFHIATLRNARHATATMDTLISLGI